METKGKTVSQKGLYQPKIADEHIRKLYHIAKRQGLKMTTRLNLIVATGLEELDRAPDICDEPAITPVVAQGPQSRVLKGGTTPDAHPAGSATKNPDCPTIRHTPYVRQRHQRQEI